MGLHTLEDLYIKHLQELNNTEVQIVKALPHILEKVASLELKNAFARDLHQTEAHIEKLERAFRKMRINTAEKKCAGMEGLIQEWNEVLGEEMDPLIRDSALTTTAQKVKDYEISAYEAAVAYARLLRDSEEANLFAFILNEKRQADEDLENIAMQGICEVALLT
jgi:ferritin-like metal-binding protein YciE